MMEDDGAIDMAIFARQLRGPILKAAAAPVTPAVALGVAISSVVVLVVLGIFSNMFRRRRPSDTSNASSVRSASLPATLACHGIQEDDLLPQEEVASGSFGELWKCMYHNEMVVLKTIRNAAAGPSDDDASTFLREITFLTNLRSPYVCTVLGGRYLATGTIQIAMEYLKKGDLKTYLSRQPEGGSHWDVCTELALDIAQGLCLLHSYGLPHGDLKSRNVLLGPIAGLDRVGAKLTDFGLTRTMQLDAQSMTTAIGVYRWTAPELLHQRALSTAADIYSFGMLLFEMDSREAPYWSQRARNGQFLSDMSVAADVLQRGLRPSFQRTCPVWVEELCLRCVEPNPAKRPTATHVRDAILESMTVAAGEDDVAPLPTFGPPRASLRNMSSAHHHSSILNVMGETLNMHGLRPWRVDEAQLQPVEEIARGAFGEVWRGLYKGNPVAIKTLIAFESHTPDDLQTFINEMSIMTTLRSKYICQMIGASWLPTCEIKLVLEYLDKGDLKNYLSRTVESPEAWSQKLLLALDIIEGLCYIHDQHIIHRDLKSRNVLLQQSGRLAAKLTDFGISRYIEMDGRSMSCGVGTYRWMAPEIILGKHYTVAVDVYSFGMILNEMDTHQVPYYNERTPEGQLITDIGIGDKVRRGLLTPQFTSGCPPWLRALALRCVAMNPEARPTAVQVRAEIKCNMDSSLFE
ncbi:serine/threonineprotein kinase [Achlya hypogyna]|uniref:Serine/threonineprotein kinase n=1 Tax=Achlya hypogyna TaxID=1202772 RepID=A0A1V9YMQ6_ACHHY|nr:serine/threonineprotein kinase [Achlya hypogyna]